ncbi:MAG: isoprenyl transferase [Firmicutes bacterium]|nr:isoprenyl transferase [Bacillota bacterium]
MSNISGAYPVHVAIIMDGNGRWAKKRFMPRIAGHKAGVESLRKIIEETGDLGIKYLTVYAFSTENWNRPKDEVNGLMNLLVNYIDNELNNLNKNGVRLNILGDMSALPTKVREKVEMALVETNKNTKLTLNIALNYGGRDEIIRAVKSIYNQGDSELIDNLDEDIFSRFLYTANIPDPDFVIRTSGEVRISNFLLWQLAYSEMYFTETLWPDFGVSEYHKALDSFKNRKRRFGKI